MDDRYTIYVWVVEKFSLRMKILELATGFSRVESTTILAFILALVIDMKIAKIATSFLADWDKCLHNRLFYYSCNI